METQRDSTTSPDRGLIWKIMLPVAIGLAVVVWLFRREFNPDVLHTIHWDWRLIACLAAALVATAFREIGFAWRFRVLTDKALSWWQALRVTMLCEFTSCVTPSTVGGSAMGMVYLKTEGIRLGRATSITMTTLILDELFFVVAFPLLLAFIPFADFFGSSHSAFTLGLRTTFWVVYAGVTLWTIILIWGVLIRPHAVATLLRRIFRLRLLSRWSDKANRLGEDIAVASADLRHRPLHWWAQTFAATVLSWTARFLVVNALFAGFVPGASQAAVFARQFVVWLVLIISPTPGGSGLSEWLFTTYYGDLIGADGMALLIAMFWRLISYYLYLVAGALIVPSWVRRSYRGQKHGK